MINQETGVLKEFCDQGTFEKKCKIMIKYVQAMVLINKNKLLPNQNRINEAVDEEVLNNNSQSQIKKY